MRFYTRDRVKEFIIGNVILGLVMATGYFVYLQSLNQVSNGEALLFVGKGYLYYVIGSFILNIFLDLSRDLLEEYGTMFVIGSALLTSGAWWIGHAVAWINLTLSEGTYKIYNLLLGAFGLKDAATLKREAFLKDTANYYRPNARRPICTGSYLEGHVFDSPLAGGWWCDNCKQSLNDFRDSLTYQGTVKYVSYQDKPAGCMKCGALWEEHEYKESRFD